MKHQILSLFLTLFLAIIVLFDPTEMGVGNQFVTVPDNILYVITMFGNITWFLGVLFMIMAVLFFVASIDDEDDAKMIAMIHTTSLDKVKKKPVMNFSLGLRVLSYVVALTAVASGFWYLGTMWIFGSLATRRFYRLYTEQINIKFGKKDLKGIDITNNLK